MVVEIELTLCSIIQGVALYFLVDNARLVLSGGQSVAWPYAATGLLVILLFWSRSLIHTLTLIRWPLEFVHNFLYIACALVESLAFTRLADPFMWFVMTALFAVIVWALFVYDLRILKLRGKDSAGSVGRRSLPRALSYLGAPRPMKMATIVSPWRYDADAPDCDVASPARRRRAKDRYSVVDLSLVSA